MRTFCFAQRFNPNKKRQEYPFIPDVFYWRYRARNTGQKCCFLILQQASFMFSRIKMYKNFHLRTYRFSCGDRNRLRTLTRFPIFQHTKMRWCAKLIKHTTDTFPYSNIEQSTFPHLRSRWGALSLQNGKRAELLPFVKLLHSYGLCPLNHQPYFPILQHCGINDPPDRLLRQSADNYFMLYLAESLTGRSYTEGKLLRYFPLWRERGNDDKGLSSLAVSP